MCTNQRLITNRYTGTTLYVPCGHCKACQQAKAQRRKRRILNNNKSGYIALSVMLSYDNFSVPFVWRSDVLEAQNHCPCPTDDWHIKVHRRCVDRYVRRGANYGLRLGRKLEDVVLENKCVNFKKCDMSHLKDLNKRKNRIGVLYYKDIQDFNKRLKQELIRNRNHDGKYSYIAVGEYGEHTLRPHWHLLIFCRISDVEIFRDSCRKCWTYGNMRRERRIEVAKNMAGYIASYVNRGNIFPAFLAENFPPKTHYSQGFGCSNSAFSCYSIISKAKRGDLSYVVKSSLSPTGYTNVLIPKYAINRFFPIFKGNTRISDSTLHDVLQFRNGHRLCKDPNFQKIGYSDRELDSISILLQHCFERYLDATGLDCTQFADDYMMVYRCYQSNLIKNNHCALQAAPLVERYFNLNELYLNKTSGKNYCFGDFPDFVEVDPNKFVSVIQETERLTEYFDNYCKYKGVNNAVMSVSDSQV